MANSVFHVMRDGPKKVSVMRDRHPPNLVCYHGNLRSNKLFLGNKKKLRYCRYCIVILSLTFKISLMRFILIEASAEFVHMSTENILIYVQEKKMVEKF